MNNKEGKYSFVFFMFLIIIIFLSGCDINDILNKDGDKKVDENSVEIGADGIWYSSFNGKVYRVGAVDLNSVT